jgi:uncharacterized membrane protein
MSRNPRVLVAILILAAAGMATATYDFIARILGVPLFCPFAGKGCDIVQSSPYAVLFGVPLAFLGILAFGAYLILAGLALRVGAVARRILSAVLALNVLEVGFMAYFFYVQVALIHAICSLCAFAAALNVAIGILVLCAVLSSPNPPPSEDERSR